MTVRPAFAPALIRIVAPPIPVRGVGRLSVTRPLSVNGADGAVGGAVMVETVVEDGAVMLPPLQAALKTANTLAIAMARHVITHQPTISPAASTGQRCN